MPAMAPVAGRLAGRVAIISGGARGQGASHARRLAGEGASVICGDVQVDEGEAHAGACRADGLDVHFQRLDVTAPDDWASAVLAARQMYGRLDVLVNNAGIIHVNALTDETLDDWNATLTVNLTGTFLGIRAAVPLLRETGGGSIINVASIFGLVGAEGYGAYCASKGGIVALTKTAALELAPDGIRVNVICPGGVSTPMNEHEPEGGVVPLTPLRRRAHVSEISGTVAFLASDDASFITGAELVIDGGFLAR